MSIPHTIVLRAETKPLEHRSVLSPSVISSLINAGYTVECERSKDRCFADGEMAAAGAKLVPTGSWPEAPLGHMIVGLKELDSLNTFPLKHTHLHFAHVFKNQPGWRDVLSRFQRGGGSLLDIEFLADPKAAGRLLSPSSFHAGFCGAILAVQTWARQANCASWPIQHPEAEPYDSEQQAVNHTMASLQQAFSAIGRLPTILVVGSAGKCGQGAVDLCRRLDLPTENIVQCGRKETSDPSFRQEVLKSDILINCVYLSGDVRPFLTRHDLDVNPGRRLSVISDVSCDGDDAANPIPVYSGHTTFQNPCMMIETSVGPPLNVIAIDHLPSLIPRDASEYCAQLLLPSLLKLRSWRDANEWKMSRELFEKKLQEAIEAPDSEQQSSSSSSSESLVSGSVNSSKGSLTSTSSASFPKYRDCEHKRVSGEESEHTSVDGDEQQILELTKVEAKLAPPVTPAAVDDSIRQHINDSFDTAVVHGGHRQHDPATGAVSMPIVMSSTYAQSNTDESSGRYVYSRKANPNRSDFERSVAVLEQADHGLAFSSGSAAISMIINLLEPYSNIVAISDAYSGTQRTFSLMAEKLNITTTYVEAEELTANLESQVTAKTMMVWIESPSNPLMQVVDLSVIATQAHAHGLLVVVDNTLASPYVFNPLAHGADIVVHSATKHLAGHSDLVIGVLATNSAKLLGQLRFLQNALGSVPSPFDCWLASRGLRTFHLRLKRACMNGQAVAEALQNSPHVVTVLYPGLASHPNRDVVMKQHKDGGAGGGIVSFRIKGGAKAADAFCRTTRFFTLAESFGSVQSLCEVPGLMTHKLLTSEERAAIGVYDDLIRLSMGIESPQDLVADVLQTLETVRSSG